MSLFPSLRWSKNLNNSLISCPRTRDWKFFQSLVVESLSNLSIKKGRQASSHEDKKIATRTKTRDKRMGKLGIATSRTSNSHGNLGQEQDKEIATRQDPCPRANHALKHVLFLIYLTEWLSIPFLPIFRNVFVRLPNF